MDPTFGNFSKASGNETHSGEGYFWYFQTISRFEIKTVIRPKAGKTIFNVTMKPCDQKILKRLNQFTSKISKLFDLPDLPKGTNNSAGAQMFGCPLKEVS